MRLRCGSQSFELRVRAAQDGHEVTLGADTLVVSLEKVAEGVFRVRRGGASRLLHLARDGARVFLSWDGVAYTLEEEREGARRPARLDPGALEAPMPGRVAAVRVAPGTRVRKGEELLVVEAMKMENALRAPRDGRVRAVHASVGEMVAPGRPLVELEP
jgi:3-methylcrotonyl-CoA carboxylase alpha subunit